VARPRHGPKDLTCHRHVARWDCVPGSWDLLVMLILVSQLRDMPWQ
jgi:hypothetical protein